MNTIAHVPDEYELLARPSKVILLSQLYQAYAYVCETKGIVPLPRDTVYKHLSNVNYTDHTSRLKKIVSHSLPDHDDSPLIIARVPFERTHFIANTYKTYHSWITPISVDSANRLLPVDQVPSNLSVAVIYITVGDIILIIWVVSTKYDIYPIHLILARSGAFVILYNLSILLIHISNVMQYIDHSLIHWLSTNASDSIHQMLGLKIMLGALVHVVAHCLHVDTVLRGCRGGCTYDYVITIPRETMPIEISWSYFLKQSDYYSGFTLIGIFTLMIIGAIGRQYGWVRMSPFYNHHRLLAILGCIGIVLHGVQQVLGFNLSYITIAPCVLVYLASRAHELFHRRSLEIIQWHATESVIRIYCNTTPYLADQLEYGVAVSAYINHEPTSRLEWHPFTIFTTSSTECCISMKGVGPWTNAFIRNITTGRDPMPKITLGHVTPSCFRFHRRYKYKIIFCSGIGITPFLSVIGTPSLADQVLLIWSVNSMAIVEEFHQVLIMLKDIPNLDIVIFYSNSARSINREITSDQWRQFYYAQQIIHYRLHLDIVHGFNIPWLLLLARSNPKDIISRYLEQMPHGAPALGIFVCSGSAYTQSIRRAANDLTRNYKKIKLDVWAEHL